MTNLIPNGDAESNVTDPLGLTGPALVGDATISAAYTTFFSGERQVFKLTDDGSTKASVNWILNTVINQRYPLVVVAKRVSGTGGLNILVSDVTGVGIGYYSLYSTTVPTYPNLVAQPDFDLPNTAWTILGNGAININHGSGLALNLFARRGLPSNVSSSAAQDIPVAINNDYEVKAYVNGDVASTIQLQLTLSTVNESVVYTLNAPYGTGWQLWSPGTFTPTASPVTFTLNTPVPPSGASGNWYVDDVVFRNAYYGSASLYGSAVATGDWQVVELAPIVPTTGMQVSCQTDGTASTWIIDSVILLGQTWPPSTGQGRQRWQTWHIDDIMGNVAPVENVVRDRYHRLVDIYNGLDEIGHDELITEPRPTERPRRDI